MELKFRAYLALYHLNPHSGSTLTDEDEVLLETTRRVDEYRTYLNQHGQDFIEDSDYAQYFNIPYVLSIDTEKHEEFRRFFEPAWKQEVSKEMKETIDEILGKEDQEDAGEDAEQEVGSGDEGEGTVRASGAGKKETGTHLEQIMRFFIKEKSNTGSSGVEPNTAFEEIETRAEEVAAEIEKVKQTNRQKMSHLSRIASKYEALKDEYENYKHQIEEQLKLDFIASPTFVLVESKNKKNAIDDREKLENEAVKSFQKELGRKLTPAENRTFRAQFKERQANYSIIGFSRPDPAKENTDGDKLVEAQWKRLLFETSRSMYAATKATKVVVKKPEPKKPEPAKKDPAGDKPVVSEETTQQEAKARVDNMEKLFAQHEPNFTKVPDSLAALLKTLGLDNLEDFDRQYKLDDEFFAVMLDSSAAVSKPVYPFDQEERILTSLTLLNQKYSQDPKFKIQREKEVFVKAHDYLLKNLTEFLAKPTENFDDEKTRLDLNILLPLNFLYLLMTRPAAEEYKTLLRDPKSVSEILHRSLDWIQNLTNSVGKVLSR